MGEKLKGDGKVTVNSATTEAVIAELSDWSIKQSRGTNSENTFDDEDWEEKSYAKASWSGSCSGYMALADAAGQEVVKAAFKAGTILTDIRFYLDYSETAAESITYYAPDTVSNANAGLLVTSCDITKDSTTQTAKISFSFEGTGPVLETTGTVSA